MEITKNIRKITVRDYNKYTCKRDYSARIIIHHYQRIDDRELWAEYQTNGDPGAPIHQKRIITTNKLKTTLDNILELHNVIRNVTDGNKIKIDINK